MSQASDDVIAMVQLRVTRRHVAVEVFAEGVDGEPKLVDEERFRWPIKQLSEEQAASEAAELYARVYDHLNRLCNGETKDEGTATVRGSDRREDA